MKRKRENMRRDSDKVVFNMVHDLEKMAKHFRGIKEFISHTSCVCPAREDYRKAVEVYDKVMMDGLKASKEAFDE